MTLEPSRRGKRKSRPTNKGRNQRQKAKKKAARARESASALGDPPEGPSRQRRNASTLKPT